MGSSRWIAIGALAAALALPARAEGPRAFSDLRLGDTEPVVAESIRDHLRRGDFARACYGCPVHAPLGPHQLVLEPSFVDGRLWRLRVVSSESGGSSGGAQPAAAVWSLLREVLERRHGAAPTTRGFPDVPAARAANGPRVWETDRWEESGRRVRLLVEQTVSYRKSRRSLRERVLVGWLPGRTPREDKVVEVRVVVEISDPEVEARIESGDVRREEQTRLVERGLELFK